MAATPTSLTEQQMQPFASGTNGAGWADVEFASETVSCFSMSIAIFVRLNIKVQVQRLTVPKLVKDNSNSLSMLFGENVVEQSRLSRAEISSDYRNWHFLLRVLVCSTHQGWDFIFLAWLNETRYLVIRGISTHGEKAIVSKW